MEPEAKYTLVGAFVIAVTVGIAATVMWLTNQGGRRDLSYYTIYFRRQSLEGLQASSQVTMKGIRVGTVESFQIAPENIEQVKVSVSVDSQTPVKTDATAIIRRNLLTGLAWIELTKSSQEAALRTEIPPNESYPVIPEGISELEEFAQSLPQLLTQGADTLKRIREVMSDENVAAVRSTLQNLDRFAQSLAGDDGDFRTALRNINQTAIEMRELGRSLKTLAKTSNDEIDKLSTQLLTTADQLSVLLRNFNDRVTDMSQTVKSSTQVIVQDVGNISQSINQAARSFSATAEHLADLRNVVGGPSEQALGPGEKVPR